MMLRKGYTAIIAVLVLVFSVVPTFAGLHFVGGAGVGTGSLVAYASIAGFGNDTDSVTVTLNVSGSGLTAWCQNKGGNPAPGQNTVSVNVGASQTVTATKAGKTTVNFHVDLLPGITSKQAGCPNKNWKVIDLTGNLRVHFLAVNNTTQEQDELKLDCFYNEPLSHVDCVPATGW
jgi:hypothetical protein